MRLWIYFIAVSTLLPALHGALLLGGAVDARQVALFLLYEATIWVSGVAVYLMDAYRTRLLGVLSRGAAVLRMAAASLATTCITLFVSPLTLAALDPLYAAALFVGAGLYGAAAGWLYAVLTRGQAP